jgi:hypothetical protein
MEISPAGWGVRAADAARWVPWGTTGDTETEVAHEGGAHVLGASVAP